MPAVSPITHEAKSTTRSEHTNYNVHFIFKDDGPRKLQKTLFE